MHENLKSILEKIARERSTASLTDADFAYLAEAVGQPVTAATDAPAPLWRFVRRNVLRFKGIFEWNFDGEVDAILVEAGASAELLKGYDSAPRFAAVVTREALKRSVRRHLTHEQPSVRAHATRLVGLLGEGDIASVLADSLEHGREERRDWGHPVIAASLEALAMLGHPQTRAFAMKYVAHDDWGLRRAAQGAALVAEGQPTKDELRRILDTQFDWSIIALLPDVFLAAAKEGTLGEDSLDRLLESLTRYITAWETVADIVVSAQWKDAFKQLIGSGDPNMRSALAVRAAWSKETWAVPMLRARLEEEDTQDARMAIVTALATIDGGDDTLLAARLESEDAGDKLGAIWGTVGKTRFREQLEKLVEDSNTQVRRAAQAALAVQSLPADPQHVELTWTDLLHNEDAWWPWKLPLVALIDNLVPLPVSAEAFRYISADAGRIDGPLLDRALALFKAHPLQLLRWLRADTPSSQRIRALGFAGLLGEGFEAALEHTLLEAQTSQVALQAALEVLAGRGPTSQASLVKARVAIYEQPRPVEGALVATAVWASYGDGDLRKRATTSLASYGAEAEPYLAMLLGSSDPDVSKTAAEVVAQLAAPRDPLLGDIAKLLSGDARKLSDLAELERLVVSMSPRVRVAVGELGAIPDIARDRVMQLFSWLIVDRDADVAAAALGALAAQAGDAKWVKELVPEHVVAELAHEGEGGGRARADRRPDVRAAAPRARARGRHHVQGARRARPRANRREEPDPRPRRARHPRAAARAHALRSERADQLAGRQAHRRPQDALARPRQAEGPEGGSRQPRPQGDDLAGRRRRHLARRRRDVVDRAARRARHVLACGLHG